MDTLIQKFKDHVIEKSQNPNFVHHKWFTKYHLEIVEKIAMELCDKHNDADRDLVLTLVWLHDYGKILDCDNQYEVTLMKGKEILEELGFQKHFVEKAISYVEIMDKKMQIDLNLTPIEIKIISSADGASHFVGPFLNFWRQDHPNKEPEELMEDNLEKIMKDWNKKIVLPEVKKAFENRFNLFLERCGQFPSKFVY
ncbi:MAG: HD domain-containing protein [bacterium]|nr:HD domain-containing protein [bacterium]